MFMPQKIFIVGCGPSLEGFDFSKLGSKMTIAVNLAMKFFYPDIFLTADSGIIRHAALTDFWGKDHCYKVVVMGPEHKRYPLVASLLPLFNERYIPTSWDGNININLSSSKFATGRNSGFCALQYAILRGYKEIYLLGFDLCSLKAKRHFYDSSVNLPIQRLEHDLENFYGHFKQAFAILKDSDIHVYSLSKISRLNDFIPYINPDSIL